MTVIEQGPIAASENEQPALREIDRLAADILNISRPYLVKMLEEGKIPYNTVGTHRRIPLNDLLTYKERRDEERLEAIREIAQISQEAGMYD